MDATTPTPSPHRWIQAKSMRGLLRDSQRELAQRAHPWPERPVSEANKSGKAPSFNAAAFQSAHALSLNPPMGS